MRRTGSARTTEHGSDRWRGVDGSTCKRVGCEEAAVIEVRDSAVRTRCEAGHITSDVFGGGEDQDSEEVDKQASDDGENVEDYRSAFDRDEAIRTFNDEEMDTKGAIDGTLVREDGYERGRPSEDEVGSDPNDMPVPVVDPQTFVDD